MNWRGTPIPKLPDADLLEAMRTALKICGVLWREIARRKLVRLV